MNRGNVICLHYIHSQGTLSCLPLHVRLHRESGLGRMYGRLKGLAETVQLCGMGGLFEYEEHTGNRGVASEFCP